MLILNFIQPEIKLSRNCLNMLSISKNLSSKLSKFPKNKLRRKWKMRKTIETNQITKRIQIIRVIRPQCQGQLYHLLAYSQNPERRPLLPNDTHFMLILPSHIFYAIIIINTNIICNNSTNKNSNMINGH